MIARGLRMGNRALAGVVWGVAVLAAPLLLRAQALVAPAQSGPWYRQVQVDLFGSLSYTYNQNHPASGLNAYRVFDFDNNQAKLDVLALTLQKAPAKPDAFGFRVDVAAGQSLPQVTAARGLFRNARTGEAGHFDVEQAYVSYIADMGRGLRFDLGKFFAPIGYESVDRYDAYNDNASHSFLFGYSAPFTTTGLKLTYPFSDKVTGMVMVVQGWDNVSDNNTGKSVGAQLAVAPTSALSLMLTYLGGPEQNHTIANWRNVVDLCATWKATSAVTLGLNADYGHERDALGQGESGHWDGAALYAVWGLSDRLTLALRAERFNDYDGARTGTPQQLDEVTLTPSYKIGQHLVVRADLRRDWSSRDVFPQGTSFTDRQATASLNVLWIY